MLFVGGLYAGPKTLWQYELEKCSKEGLLYLVNLLLSFTTGAKDHEFLLDCIRDAYNAGKQRHLAHRLEWLSKDPEGCFETHDRRQRSAKSAARRRKKKARIAAKEAR